jgi:hypothetical protein
MPIMSFLLSILVETWANLFVPELAWFPFVLILWGCLERLTPNQVVNEFMARLIVHTNEHWRVGISL